MSSHAFVFLIEEHALQLLDILATDDALDLPDTTGLVFNVVVVVFVVVSGGGPRAKAARAFHTVGHVGARPGDTNGPVRLTNEACRLLSDSWLVMTDFCFGGALDKDVRRGRGIASSAGIGIFKASAKVGEGSVKVREGSAKGRQSSRRFRTRENRVILNDGHPVSIGGVVQLVDTNAVDERRRTAIGEVLVNRGVAAKASAVVALDAAVPPEAVIIVAGDNRVRAIRVIVVAGDNRIRSIHVIVVACHRASSGRTLCCGFPQSQDWVHERFGCQRGLSWCRLIDFQLYNDDLSIVVNDLLSSNGRICGNCSLLHII